MMELKTLEKKHGARFIAASVALLALAFFQCYKITHDLHWAYDTDFDRDMAFIRNSLEGNYGKDPNYIGEYLWYNPLLFSIETFIVKMTGLPINVVIAQAGIYFNILGPIAFFIMNCYFFGYRLGLAALLSFLFLASGNLVGTGSATYSPWAYPCCFAQFLFYLMMMACYKAFTLKTYTWFFVVGLLLGTCFLAHAAPAFLTILILVAIQGKNMFLSAKTKKYDELKKYFAQGCATFISFVIVSSPFLYYIAGKYHFHIVNKNIFEYQSELLIWWNFPKLLKANLSIAFIVSIIGFIWFYKNFHEPIIRKIILNWFYISAFMLGYTILLPGIHDKLHIPLPDTVPSYHYLHYLKAVQSVFFGFGFVYLFQKVYQFIKPRLQKTDSNTTTAPTNLIFIIAILVWAIAYFPIYKNRKDFVELRKESLVKQNSREKIEVYDYIVKNIPSDKVILCEEQYSIFPVMATGRKLVCASILFSNPYVDFGKRYADVNAMLGFIRANQPDSSKKLFDHYKISYALLANTEIKKDSTQSPLLGSAIFKNDMFTLFPLNREDRVSEK
ncbi:MAG: hypothetical protein JST75_19245 [Bacteroidetes bacterium]|nr:hypothetical protein [Bacteroidota bacterium]